jgi:hypothetical protein
MKAYAFIFVFVLAYTSCFSQSEKISVSFAEDTLIISNKGLYVNCGSRYSMYLDIQGATITLMERDTSGQLMFCECYFDLEARVVGLAAGSYSLIVRREHLMKYGWPVDDNAFIGTLNFDVTAGGLPVRLTKGYQSDCSQVSSVSDASITPPNDVTIMNYPNPVENSTTIRYTMKREAVVRIIVYNSLGMEQAEVLNAWMPAGSHELVLGPEMFLNRGVYYCVIRTGTTNGAGQSSVARILF